MNSQHKITISGIVFYVEENCRRPLMDQLNSDNASSKEYLTNDLLAELLLKELKENGKDIVSTKVLKHVIQKAQH